MRLKGSFRLSESKSDVYGETNSMFTLDSDKNQRKQGCIPVGCVPSAAVAVCWSGEVSARGGLSVQGRCLPRGCASRGSVCFQGGWCFQGVCFRGVCFLGGCSQGVCASGGCIPACTEVATPSRPCSLNMNTLEGFVTYTKRLPEVTLLTNSFYEVSRVPTFLSCQIPWFSPDFSLIS